MAFIKPMLASAMPKNFFLEHDAWTTEKKYDGHRLIVEVYEGIIDGLFAVHEKSVRAWSRHGLARILPKHLIEALKDFPMGVYDGELVVPGFRSYGVTELTNGPELVYTMFDILEVLREPVTDLSYDARRAFLSEIFSRSERDSRVVLAESTPINSLDEAQKLCEAVWANDEEGLILKRRSARYVPGKRSKDFIKMKALLFADLTVTGFEPSKGLIQNRGDYAMVCLVDEHGNATTVKTLNDAWLTSLEKEAEHAKAGKHPRVGHKLRIKYQERTPDGSYRHPRWHQWI